MSTPLEETPSFNRGLDHYTSTKHHGRCHMCATCASLYIRNRHKSHSLRDDVTSVIECTEHGVFTTPRPYSDEAMSKKSKVLVDKLTAVFNTTLLYGAALYHTERELNLEQHTDTQIRLLTEAYSILCRGQFQDSDKISIAHENELILYMELTHPIEKAVTSNGQKITHPHVWIRTCLKPYGPPNTTIMFPLSGISESDFIAMTVDDGTVLLEENPSSKVYVKYYLNAHTYAVKRCEIDVDYPKDPKPIIQ